MEYRVVNAPSSVACLIDSEAKGHCTERQMPMDSDAKALCFNHTRYPALV
jgi:hypothetical protein